MKYYYFLNGLEKCGPFSFEELKSKRLKKNTFVWCEGMDEWQVAEKISELENILLSETPPIPKFILDEENLRKNISENSSIETSKYDLTYEGDGEAGYVGIVFLMVNTVIGFNRSNIEDHTYIALGILGLILRFVFANWINLIAKKQNRQNSNWAIFGFLFPALALTIIGFLKKLKINNGEKVTENINLPNKTENKDKIEKEEIVVIKNISELDFLNYENLSLNNLSEEELKIIRKKRVQNFITFFILITVTFISYRILFKNFNGGLNEKMDKEWAVFYEKDSIYQNSVRILNGNRNYIKNQQKGKNEVKSLNPYLKVTDISNVVLATIKECIEDSILLNNKNKLLFERLRKESISMGFKNKIRSDSYTQKRYSEFHQSQIRNARLKSITFSIFLFIGLILLAKYSRFTSWFSSSS